MGIVCKQPLWGRQTSNLRILSLLFYSASSPGKKINGIQLDMGNFLNHKVETRLIKELLLEPFARNRGRLASMEISCNPTDIQHRINLLALNTGAEKPDGH